MNPFSSGTRLRDMIRAIRACKTAAEERAVVRKECAAIRSSISENDSDYRHRNLAKLMFIHMLGYSTHFGQMECLKLIAAVGFPEKRIGYLGLMLLLDERQEVLMLVTNSLKQDLNHTNQYIVGLALCALGNICSSEMARDLAPEVERLLQFRDPNIRKKAALCSIRIIRKAPDLAENFINPAASLLKEKHHGVLVTGIQLSTDLCKVSSEALEYFRKKCTEDLVKLLRDVVNSPYSPEYDVAGIMDPFLHVRLLQLLKILGQGNVEASDCMNDILAQVATKTESNKNAGNAILYECVKTIFGVEDNGGLRVLAINLLGKFLSNRDNNIRYVALNMLVKVITVDPQAVQRHRTTILECVKDADASIRKRALELVYLLVNETNYQHLTEELIDYLEVSDPEFKGYLTDKICLIVEKFLSEKVWYIDQMLRVLCEAGSFVKDSVWHFLIVVIGRSPDLHGYTVRSLYKAARESPEQQVLVRVAVWCIGEYGDMLVVDAVDAAQPPLTVTETDAVDAVEGVMKHHDSDLTTHAMSMIALLKLSSRFPQCAQRIRDLITEYRGNHVLELQQRSIEFYSIIDRHRKITHEILERMPVLDEATYSRRAASVSPSRLPNGTSKSFAIAAAAAAPPLLDLLDLSTDDDSGGRAAAASSADSLIHDLLGIDLSPGLLPPAGDGAVKNGTDVLLDLLSIGAAVSEPLVTPPAQPPLLDLLTPEREVSSVVAYESESLRIRFDFSKNEGGDARTCFVRSVFENLSDSPYTGLVFQAAVPKFLQLHLEPASGNLLPPAGNGSVYQRLQVTNTQHGKKPLVMRIRVAYKRDGKDVLEQGQISNFPRDL